MRGQELDVAIYMPYAAGHYRLSGPIGGGAELQTVLLARALVARGLRVGHIVWPIEDPVPAADSMPALIHRAPNLGDRRFLGGAAEALSIWRSMAAANARAYIFRTGRSRLVVAAMFCQAHRRKLVYAGANDLDFTFDGAPGPHSPPRGYRRALRRTDAIVTQTGGQLRLARSILGEDHRLTTIPSFVEPAARRKQKPDGFIWIGRLVRYKQPLEYVRLAEAMPDTLFRIVFELDNETPPETLDAVRAAAERLPNLDLLGQIPRERVLELIERSFAVVSTSTHEGMPNVFLEAWARGVPVASLVFDPGGQIETREAGLVAGGSRRQLVDIAESLQHDESLRERLGANGRRYVDEVHDPDGVADRWMALLGDLLGSSRARP
jgi:glycosyltransferase involved in cell wall biosynthesis